MNEIAALSTEDNDLPLSIIHARDTIIIDGRVEQDYRFLVYTFEGGAAARMYLDDPWEVSITAPIDGPPPAPVMAYLQRRFAVIKQLGGEEGYRIIWAEVA